MSKSRRIARTNPPYANQRLISLLIASLLSTAALGPATAWADPVEATALVSYDIPSQDMASALLAFSRQTGLQLVVSAGDVKNLRSNALSGKHSLQSALNNLLDGSGLNYRITGKTLVIRLAPKDVEGTPHNKSTEMDAALPAPIPASEPQLEEVIVTAQKRSENLQDVPISVQALDSRALEKTGIVSLSDIKSHVPGMTIDSYPGSSEMLFPSIRGIVPNAIQVSVPIPMAIHLDGVALTQIAGLNLAGADLERIEVLKGPQGVLAGRNATGGAINIVTMKPDLGQFGFKQQITVAERGQWLSKTVVNVPLSDTFAAKVSYLHSERDNLGVKNSAPTGPKFGEKTSDAWHLDLRWKAANNVMVDYGYDRSETESYDQPQQCLVPFLGTATMSVLATRDARLQAALNGCSLDKLDTLNVPFDIPKNRNLAEGHNLTVSWDVDPTLTFRSITGYRKVNTRNSILFTGFGEAGNPYLFRGDTAPVSFLGGSTPFDGQNHPWTTFNEAWSQEFHLLGDVSPNLTYTTGLYFATEKGHQKQCPMIYVVTPGVLFPPSLIGVSSMVGIDRATLDYRATTAKNSTWAVFGQFSWRPDILTRKLEIVPGVRYTRDHREATNTNLRGETYFYTATATPGVNNLLRTFPNFSAYTNATGENSFSKTTPSVSFNYHWDDSLMTYLKMAKGYVTGGFDGFQPTAEGFSKGYAPETITSYELGLKGEFFNRRLRINGAVFSSEYKNEQKPAQHANRIWAIENVGSSKYKGAELDIIAQVTDGFRISGSVTWLDHKYSNWIDQDSSSPTYLQDVAKFRKLVVPKVSYVINLDYRFPNLGLPGKLDANLNFAHRDAQSTPFNSSTPGDAENLTTPKHDVINGRLALSNIKVGLGGNGDLTVALWGKNLANKKYQGFTLTNTSAARATNWSEPRTYGIDVIYNY